MFSLVCQNTLPVATPIEHYGSPRCRSPLSKTTLSRVYLELRHEVQFEGLFVSVHMLPLRVCRRRETLWSRPTIARTESRVADRPFRIFVPRISPASLLVLSNAHELRSLGQKGETRTAYPNYVRRFEERDWKGSTIPASCLITCQTFIFFSLTFTEQCSRLKVW